MNIRKSRKRWNLVRHRVMFSLLRLLFGVYLPIVYGFSYKKTKLKKNEPCIVIANHTSSMDQFIVPIAFNRVIHFLASDNLFVMKVGKLLKYLVAPIPKTKSNADIRAIRDARSAIQEKAIIGLFPEGNRSYTGKLCHIPEGIVKLIRMMKVPVYIYKIYGGYGVNPRWAADVRKGKSHGELFKKIEFAEYNLLSDDELYKLIVESLEYDDVEWAKENGILYKSKKQAEYLERVLYYCPTCQSYETLKSEGIYFSCEKCNMKLEYTPTLEFKGVGSSEVPFSRVLDWYNHQEEAIKKDLANKLESPKLYYQVKDIDAFYYTVGNTYKDTYGLSDFIAYNDRFELVSGNQTRTFWFKDISAVSVLGKNNIIFYVDKEVTLINMQKRMCGLKFAHLFYIMKGQIEGNHDVGIMGL